MNDSGEFTCVQLTSYFITFLARLKGCGMKEGLHLDKRMI